MSEDDKAPFLPLNRAYADDKMTFSPSPSLPARSRSNTRKWLLTIGGIVFGAILLGSFLHLSPSSTETVNATLNNLLQPSRLAASQQVSNYTLPHNYTGTFPSAKLNRTLGFEKIYIINLPNRQDKRDEMTIQSYMTDIDVEFFEGVKGTDIPHQVIADYTEHQTPGVLGCYRSHVHVLRAIVESGVESALVLEDDPDWDKDLRLALERAQDPFARLIGSMKQDGQKRGPTDEFPWGDTKDWDQLYTGACLESPWTPTADDKQSKKEYNLIDGKKLDFNHAPYVAYEDDLMPASSGFNQNTKDLYKAYGIDADPTSNKTAPRIIQKARRPVCTDGYAVTRRGALRLLYELTRGPVEAVDWLMAHASEEGRVETYTIYPPLMAQWRITDGGYRNTDVNNPNPVQKRAIPDIGYSENIRNSIRANFKKTIRPRRAIEL